MGTKNQPGRFDCYDAAEPDEPIFILLARDPVAADLVREWVKRRQALDGGSEGDKHMEALACAASMDVFRLALTNRVAPPVVRADD